MKKLTLDKYMIKFNCPSEDNLQDRGCTNTATMGESTCRKCWLEAIALASVSAKRNDIDKALTQLATGELEKFTIEIEGA